MFLILIWPSFKVLSENKESLLVFFCNVQKCSYINWGFFPVAWISVNQRVLEAWMREEDYKIPVWGETKLGRNGEANKVFCILVKKPVLGMGKTVISEQLLKIRFMLLTSTRISLYTPKLYTPFVKFQVSFIHFSNFFCSPQSYNLLYISFICPIYHSLRFYNQFVRWWKWLLYCRWEMLEVVDVKGN